MMMHVVAQMTDARRISPCKWHDGFRRWLLFRLESWWTAIINSLLSRMMKN